MVDSNITEISETSLASTLLTIGVQLCAARKETGRSVADVANELRINAGYLNAIEKGELDALPSSTYVAGFLRSYGNLVGFEVMSWRAPIWDVSMMLTGSRLIHSRRTM